MRVTTEESRVRISYASDFGTMAIGMPLLHHVPCGYLGRLPARSCALAARLTTMHITAGCFVFWDSDAFVVHAILIFCFLTASISI